ncbi:plastocyanin-like domain protein [Senna tora]|uniref:Plastocyanin-like domain protein n=1 Tax=Senna tora TaxID=362788 RepID=A0A834XAF5_9FABA|nr:plastocyanin-like domain protein [Senna tora]
MMILLITAASMVEVSMGNKDMWNWGNYNLTDWWNQYQFNRTQTKPQNVVVGGSQNWQFGFNYTAWAIKNSPFYLNDTLVFKYAAPNATTFPHSVYMFSNYKSFLNCDLTRAKMVANTTQGRGEGFKFLIKRWQPHYFACGERNGIHCKNGLMKFAVLPAIRPFW